MRLLQLERFWQWLPLFRVVAETHSISEAASLLARSPSAVSRTIKALEEEMGTALFVRHGRGLVLTADGETLLAATRAATRTLDDALAKLGAARPVVCKVACVPEALFFVGAALSRLRLAYEVSELSDEGTAGERVARGEIDLAIVFVGRSVHLPKLLAEAPIGTLAFTAQRSSLPLAAALGNACAGGSEGLPVGLARHFHLPHETRTEELLVALRRMPLDPGSALMNATEQLLVEVRRALAGSLAKP